MNDDEKSVLLQAAKDAAIIARMWRYYAVLRDAKDHAMKAAILGPEHTGALEDFDLYARSLRDILENNGAIGSFNESEKGEPRTK
jgi:hypothetical protein